MSDQYIEDIYIQFFKLYLHGSLKIDEKDLSAARSFYVLISSENCLTEKQARLAVVFLKKYQLDCIILNLDYSQTLDSASWKRQFRIIDNQRKIFVDTDNSGKLVVCLKFPYSLIKEFEQEIKIINAPDLFGFPTSYYDKDKKLKIIPIYDINLVKLNEFVLKNNFEIDHSFEMLISYVEDVWQNDYEILPHAIIEKGKIKLKNCKKETEEFFEHNKYKNYYDNIFLAKTMGYPLKISSENILEKLCSNYGNLFWIDNIGKLFEIAENISGKIAILLDKSIDTEQWINQYVNVSDQQSISRNLTKVCFREPTDYKPNFNSLIKNLGFTGSLNNAKYYIFKHKPAKWLIRDIKQIKIIITTSAFKISNQDVEFWKGNHPCVIYLNDFKPMFGKGIDIVKL